MRLLYLFHLLSFILDRVLPTTLCIHTPHSTLRTPHFLLYSHLHSQQGQR